MNRSILIVICDFLLISLLAFSSVDINKVGKGGADRTVKMTLNTNQVDPKQDLGNVMRLALQEEKRSHQMLLGELKQTREMAEQRQAQLTEREKQLLAERQNRENLASELTKTLSVVEDERKTSQQLAGQLTETKQVAEQRQAALTEREKQLASERKAREQVETQLEKTRQEAEREAALVSQLDKRVQIYQEEIKTRDQQAAQFAQQQAALQQQVAAAQAAYTAAQANLQNLTQQSQGGSVDSVVMKERLAASENEARKRLEASTALQQQLTALQQSNQVMATEKVMLSTQLQVTEAQRKAASEQAAHLEEEVKVERREKEKLVSNLDTLAKNSGQLAAEIRENRSLTPNNVFSEFANNRIQTHFKATRSTLFGIDSTRNRETQSILVTDGKVTYALCHVQETPLVFSDPGLDWEGLDGTLQHGTAALPIRYFSFHRFDPRIVLIPISEADAKSLRCRIYRTSPEPFKFSDAVVVGPKEGYYGECRFQIDLSTPGYVKMDRNSLTGLFGKFNPSSGDLVFSKTGELLGVMCNSTYCMVIRDFSTATTFKFGPNVPDQHTGFTLAQFYTFIGQLPFKLQ